MDLAFCAHSANPVFPVNTAKKKRSMLKATQLIWTMEVAKNGIGGIVREMNLPETILGIKTVIEGETRRIGKI